MSGRSRQLRIEILGDARDAQRAFDALEKSSGGLGDKLGNVASIASGFIVAEGLMRLPGLFSSTVEAGSNLEESINAVNQIFGDSAQAIHAWGETNANSFGLSQRAFNDLAVPLGAGLKNAGLSMDEVTDHTITLTERAADMASVFNTDVDEALAAIQAGLRGQADPLEKYGVGLTAARVEQEALAMSGKAVASELTEEEKMLARVSLIMQQTEDVAGDFANTSDGVANSARIAAARQEELAAMIGEQLLPVQQAMTEAKLEFLEVLATKVIPAVIDFTDALQDRLRPVIEGFVKGPLKDAKEALDDLRDLFDDMPKSLDEIQDALEDISFDDITSGLSGIGSRIVGAISGSLDQVDWSGVRSKISGGLTVGFTFAVDQAQDIVNSIATTFDQTDWGAVRQKVTDGLFGGISAVEKGATGVGQSIANNLSTQLESVDWSAVQTTIRDGVMGGLSATEEGATGAGEQIQTWLTSEVEALEDWEQLGKAIKGGVVTGLTAASGIAGLTVALIDWIAGEITEGEGDWSTIAGNIATKIGDAFTEAVAIGEQVVGWITRSLEDVEWQETADAIAAGIATAIREVSTLAQAIADSIADNFGEVDWSVIGWETASGEMTLGLGESLGAALTDEFGKIDLEAIVRDSGLVLTPEVMFGEGGLADTLEDLTDALTDIATVLKEDVGPTIDEAREAWEEWQPILEPLLGLILDLNLAMGTTLIKFALAPLIQTLEGVAKWLGIFFDATQTGLKGVQLLGEEIKTFVGGIGTITGWAETATGAIVGWSDTSVGKAGEFLDGMLGPIDETAISGAEKISGFVQASATSLLNWVDGSKAKARNFFDGVIEKIQQLIDEAPGKISEFVQAAVDEIGTLPQRAKDGLGDLSGTLYQAGRDLVQGFIDGILSLIPDVRGAASDLAGAAIDTVTGFGDSPWPAMIRAGRDAGDGLVIGLRAKEPEVYGAAEALGFAATAGLNESLLDGAVKLFSDLEGVTAEMVEPFEKYVAAVIEDGDTLNDWLTHLPDEWRPWAEAVGNYIAAVMEDGDTLNDWLTHVPEEHRAALQEIGQVWADGLQEAISDNWLKVLDDLEGIASGDVQKRLMDTLTDLGQQLAAAIELGAPQEVIDAIKAQIAEAEAELAAVGEVAGSAIVAGMQSEALREEMTEEARKRAEEIAEAMADEWEQRTDNLIDPERTAGRIEEDLAEIAAKIAAGEAGGAPQAVLDAWREEEAALQKEASQFWEDLARQAVDGIADPKVLKEIGAAGNEQFQEYLKQFAGDERAKEITAAIDGISKAPLDELKQRFAEAPEIADQFVDDLVNGVEAGTWRWEDVMGVLSVLPREQLIPILEQLADEFEVDLTEAMIAADATAQDLAANGLAAVNAELEAVTGNAEAANSALDNLPGSGNYQAPGDQSPDGGSGSSSGGPGSGGDGTGVLFGPLVLPQGVDFGNAQKAALSQITNALGTDFVYAYLVQGLAQQPPRSIDAMIAELEVLASGAPGKGAGLSGGSGSGAGAMSGGANITIVNNLRRADADEIAYETAQALRFAALDPVLVGQP